MKQLKNPFVALAFGLTLLFFIPLPKDYLGIKIVIALIVIAYAVIALGAFKKKQNSNDKFIMPEKEKNYEDVEKELKEWKN